MEDVPDVVGLRLDVARRTLQLAGHPVAGELDVDEGRSIWEPANWTVVAQTEAPEGVYLDVTNHARAEMEAQAAQREAERAIEEAQREAERAIEEAQREAEREDAARADEARSVQFEADLKYTLGVAEFTELLARDATLWGGWIAGARIEGDLAIIRMFGNVDLDPWLQDMGDRAARALVTLLPQEALDGVGWIVIEDGSGVQFAMERVEPCSALRPGAPAC